MRRVKVRVNQSKVYVVESFTTLVNIDVDVAVSLGLRDVMIFGGCAPGLRQLLVGGGRQVVGRCQKS
jgi:hypothetical protein